MHDAPTDLAVDDQWINQSAAIVDHHVANYADVSGFGVDFDLAGVRAGGVSFRFLGSSALSIARLAFVIHVTEWNRSRAAIVAHARARRQISYFLKEFQRLCCDWRQLLEPSSGVWNARVSEILFLEAIRR